MSISWSIFFFKKSIRDVFVSFVEGCYPFSFEQMVKAILVKVVLWPKDNFSNVPFLGMEVDIYFLITNVHSNCFVMFKFHVVFVILVLHRLVFCGDRNFELILCEKNYQRFKWCRSNWWKIRLPRFSIEKNQPGTNWLSSWWTAHGHSDRTKMTRRKWLRRLDWLEPERCIYFNVFELDDSESLKIRNGWKSPNINF